MNLHTRVHTCVYTIRIYMIMYIDIHEIDVVCPISLQIGKRMPQTLVSPRTVIYTISFVHSLELCFWWKSSDLTKVLKWSSTSWNTTTKTGISSSTLWEGWVEVTVKCVHNLGLNSELHSRSPTLVYLRFADKHLHAAWYSTLFDRRKNREVRWSSRAASAYVPARWTVAMPGARGACGARGALVPQSSVLWVAAASTASRAHFGHPGPLSAATSLPDFHIQFSAVQGQLKSCKSCCFFCWVQLFWALGHFLGDGSGVPGSAWLQRCQSGTASSSGPAGALHLWGQWDGADALPAGAGMCPASTTGWRSRGPFSFRSSLLMFFFCLRKIPMQNKTWPPWSDKVWVNFWIIRTFRLLSPDAV